ncbi:DUF6600 domain-containing protein [Sandarakinorhabdus sp.]|uniref:DUF6600 domain-containing protein n=1 Tax=Sandarakinorhabdus sp. TaxID=1916663 RepID=UPI003F70883E
MFPRTLAVLLALAVGGCAYPGAVTGSAPVYPAGYQPVMGGFATDWPAQPGALWGPEDVPSIDVFFEPLSQHGRWVQTQWGQAFQPAAPQGWRPYQNGQWLDNRFWMSGDPWGWATDHYGRWGFDQAIGWVWVPGTNWGPSWVAWREADEVVGWAPIPPRIAWNVGVGFGGGWGFDNFNSWYGPSWVWVPRGNLFARGFGGGILPWNTGFNYWGRSRWQHTPYWGWNQPYDRNWGWRAPGRGFGPNGYAYNNRGYNQGYNQGYNRGRNPGWANNGGQWGGNQWGRGQWGGQQGGQWGGVDPRRNGWMGDGPRRNGWNANDPRRDGLAGDPRRDGLAGDPRRDGLAGDRRRGQPGSVGDRIGRDLTGQPQRPPQNWNGGGRRDNVIVNGRPNGVRGDGRPGGWNGNPVGRNRPQPPNAGVSGAIGGAMAPPPQMRQPQMRQPQMRQLPPVQAQPQAQPPAQPQVQAQPSQRPQRSYTEPQRRDPPAQRTQPSRSARESFRSDDRRNPY